MREHRNKKGQTLYQWLYLRPYFGEYWCVLSVFLAETMHLRTPIIIIVRLWLDEGVERIHYLAITHKKSRGRRK